MVSPVYDDAASAAQLLGHLQRVFAQSDVKLHVLFVDDGSPVPLTYQLSAMQIFNSFLVQDHKMSHQRASGCLLVCVARNPLRQTNCLLVV